VCEIDASGAEDEDALLERVAAALRVEIERAAGLPLALRVRIIGPCEAHPALCAEPEKWFAEIRQLAGTLGEVWIEKIKLETSHQHDLAEILSRDDPMARLIRSIHEMEVAPELLDEFLPALNALKTKLPAELLPNEQFAFLSDDARRRQCLEEVRQLLLPRLLPLTGAR
jgi:exonuclease SbcD